MTYYFPNGTMESCVTDEDCRMPLLCYPLLTSDDGGGYCSCSSWWFLTGPQCSQMTTSTWLEMAYNLTQCLVATFFALFGTADLVMTYRLEQNKMRKKRRLWSFKTLSTVASTTALCFLAADSAFDIHAFRMLCYNDDDRQKCNRKAGGYFRSASFLCNVVSMMSIAVVWDTLSAQATIQNCPVNSSKRDVLLRGMFISLVSFLGCILMIIVMEIDGEAAVVSYLVYIILVYFGTNAWHIHAYRKVEQSFSRIAELPGVANNSRNLLIAHELSRLKMETFFVAFGNLVTCVGAFPSFTYNLHNGSLENAGRDSSTSRAALLIAGADLISAGVLISGVACIVYNADLNSSYYTRLLKILRLDLLSTSHAVSRRRDSPDHGGAGAAGFNPEALGNGDDDDAHSVIVDGSGVAPHTVEAMNALFTQKLLQPTTITKQSTTWDVTSVISNISASDDARLFGYGDGFVKNGGGVGKVQWITKVDV